MSARGLSAGAIAELGNEVTESFSLLRVDFSTKKYYTDAPYDIDYDDGDGLKTYSSSSVCPKFPDIKESIGLKPSSLPIVFSGSSAQHALTLTEDYKNLAVKIYRVIGNGISSVECATLFDGFLDSYSTTENQQKGTSKVTWNCVSHWANWEAVNGRVTNSISQERIGFTGDLFFEFTGVTDEVQKYWGGISGLGGITAGENWLYLSAQANVNWQGVPQWYQDVYSGRTIENSYYNYEANRGASKLLPLVYGQVATKGIPVFRAVTGLKSEYLWVVYALSEGECEGLTGDKIIFDKKKYTHSDLANTVTHIFYGGSDAQNTGGVERLVNGDFVSDVSGWLGTNCTPVWDAGTIGTGSPTDNFKYLHQSFTVSKDSIVNISVDAMQSGTATFGIGTTATNLDKISISASSVGTSTESVFLTAGTYYFTIRAYDTNLANIYYYDNCEAKEDYGVGDGIINANDLISASANWTSAHEGKGVAYVIVRYTYDKAVWTEAPEPLFILKGKKCIDPNNTLNPAAYTKNPVWHLYDYLTNARYGKGIPAANLAEFDTGATYAATTNEPYSGGAAIPLFEFTGVIDTAKSIKKNAEAILFTCRGDIAWIGGNYTLVIESHISPASAYSFNDDNIAGTFTVKEQGIKSLLNMVEYEYIQPSNGYGADVVSVESSTFLAEDNNRVLRKKFTNKHETNYYRARSRASTLLKQSREVISVSFDALKADALQIECGDIINITRSVQGWVAKLFRVHEMVIKPNGSIQITKAVEYEPSAFDWSVSVEATPPADTILVDPFIVYAVPSVTTSTGTARTTKDGTSVARLKITWQASVSQSISHYEVQVKESADADKEYRSLANVDASGDLVQYLENVPEGISLDARVRAVNTLGKVSGWVESTDRVITGVNILGTGVNNRSTDNINGDNYYFRTFFESLDNYTVDTNVTKGDNDNGFKITSTNSSFVYKWLYYDLLELMTWLKKRTCRTKIYLSNTGTDGTVLVGMGFGSSYVVAKFVYNSSTSQWDFYAESSKDTVTETTALLASFADSSSFEIKIVTTPLSYYSYVNVNGVSSYVGTSATFPINSKNIPMYYYVHSVAGGTLTASVDEFFFLQEA